MKTLTTTTALGTLLAAAPAAAQERVALEAASNPSNTVRWLGARSTLGRDVGVVMDDAGRSIRVVTSGGDTVAVDGSCPDPTVYDGVGVNLGKAPAKGKAGCNVAHTGNGDFTLVCQSPSKPGDALKATVACTVPGTSGVTHEALALVLETQRAVFGHGGQGTPVDLSPRLPDPLSPASQPMPQDAEDDASEPDTGESNGRLVEAGVDVTWNTPLRREGETGVGVAAHADVGLSRNPPRRGFRGWALGLLARVAKVGERILGKDGEERDLDVPTQLLAARIGPRARLVRHGAFALDLDAGVGVGIGHANGVQTGADSNVPGTTRPVGTLDAGLQVGGTRVRGRLGWNGVFSDREALQSDGPTVGVTGEW